MALSQSDLEQLIREPSVTARVSICEKLCEQYNHQEFDSSEKALADEIFTLLLKDVSRRVRQTLAEQLCYNQEIPKEIVDFLARDHESVAVSILQNSPLLSEEDLMDIIAATKSATKLLAISKRQSLSAQVSKALIASGEYDVMQSVLHNAGAKIHEESYEFLLEEFQEDESMLELMVFRASLPSQIAEKLFTLVSEDLKQQLSKRFELPIHLAEDATSSAREVSLMRFISPWMSQQDIQRLVEEMHKQKRLTDSAIIRSLCVGDMRFFKAAMAKRANIGQQTANLLMLDPGKRGFMACYKKAGLPEDFAEAIYVLFNCAMEESDFGQYVHDQFTQRLMQRIVANQYDRDISHMTYVMTILRKTIHDTPTVH